MLGWARASYRKGARLGYTSVSFFLKSAAFCCSWEGSEQLPAWLSFSQMSRHSAVLESSPSPAPRCVSQGLERTETQQQEFLFQRGRAGLGGKLSSFVGSFSFGRAWAAPSLLRPLLAVGASGEGGDDKELCPTPVGKMMDSSPPAKIRRGGWLPGGMSQCPTAAK